MYLQRYLLPILLTFTITIWPALGEPNKNQSKNVENQSIAAKNVSLPAVLPAEGKDNINQELGSEHNEQKFCILIRSLVPLAYILGIFSCVVVAGFAYVTVAFLKTKIASEKRNRLVDTFERILPNLEKEQKAELAKTLLTKVLEKID